MPLKDRYPKPRIRMSGGLYYIERELYRDQYHRPATKLPNVFAVFTRHRLNSLIEAYKWWNARKPADAAITDAMLIRYADFWRYEGPDSASAWCGDPIRTLARHPKFKARKVKEYKRVFSKLLLGKGDINLTAEVVAEMIEAGYCRVSNNFRTLSRIDRPDWREVLAVAHCAWDPSGAGMQAAMSSRAGDSYRRCHSQDKVTLPRTADHIFKMFPSSCDGPDHFSAYEGPTYYGGEEDAV